MVEFFILVLLASLVILVFLLARLWAQRHSSGAIELLLCSLACGLWSLGYIFEIMFPTLSSKLWWAKFEYIGISTVSVWVLLFILRYIGRSNWFNIQHMSMLLIIPALTFLFTITNEYHHLMWTETLLQSGWIMAPLSLSHGSWFWIQIGYSYLLLLGATVLLGRFIFSTQKIYSFQSMMMMLAMLIPWLGNALYILGIRPGPSLDLTPIAFTVTNLGLFLGFVRFRLLDILPVAYSSIFKFMSDGVIVIDGKNRVVDINPAARRIFRRSDLTIPTQPHPNIRGALDPFIGHALNEFLPSWDPGSPLVEEFEKKEISLNMGAGRGSRFYILVTTPIHNRREQVTGQVLLFTDVTNLKKTEEQMKLQVTALETAENGIVITDSQGLIEWANPAYTWLTGYLLAESVGKNPRFLKSGVHNNAYYQNLWETITAGKVWHGEVVNKRKDGSLYDEEMTITPLSQPDGSIAHYIAIKQDISKRKRAEEQLKEAHEQAIESNRLKTQLLANVSHDMRTPLGAIMGYSEMLGSGIFGKLTGEQERAISDIQDSANQLLLFVNNLIGQAQVETGKILIKAKPFDVADLVEACRASVSLQASRKGLCIDYEIDPLLPKSILGDLYWLRQILLNLVSNALKFTDEGSITLRLFLASPDYWCMEVTDTGIGISTDMQTIIFEPFRQAERSPAYERSGSGLGLAIVKELTSLMGGQIYLSSKPGVGSTFTVYIPNISEKNVN